MFQKAAMAGALMAILTALAPQPRCLASTLPQPAARFLHYFQKTEGVKASESRQVSVWERLVVSLIWATSTPAKTDGAKS
jgi:hypothetical protein